MAQKPVCPFLNTMCVNGKIFYDPEASAFVPAYLDKEINDMKHIKDRVKQCQCQVWNEASDECGVIS